MIEDISRSIISTPDRGRLAVPPLNSQFNTNMSQDALNDTSFYSIGPSCKDNSFLSRSNFDHSKISLTDRDVREPSINLGDLPEKSFKKAQNFSSPYENIPQVEELRREFQQKINKTLEEYREKNEELNR